MAPVAIVTIVASLEFCHLVVVFCKKKKQNTTRKVLLGTHQDSLLIRTVGLSMILALKKCPGGRYQK